ncbi:hypothetical protein PACTADRAFT_2793 [Pachysolen tannophilus NRRL Y-2460]|uniref:Uncharacterized protein n=1 Tax=Pachysolen tannophilus NRRL Y-2460 TaxID=669874 RepID=A0A1E4TXL9_PACTA|nr:hypothetical protein PACTADRAFT_2793 [Pachysolen tannophilus NRRL Y-2460]
MTDTYDKVFNVQIFFVVFRESLEAFIVMSVLLAFIDKGFGTDEVAENKKNEAQQLNKKLKIQVIGGGLAGFAVCLAVGITFIAVFYTKGSDLYAKTEDLWEGVFCIVASLLITVMGVGLLRVSKMQDKWRVKLKKALVDKEKEEYTEIKETRNIFKKIGKWFNNVPKYFKSNFFMFWLPFITCLREGLEAVVFIGGVGIGKPASGFVLPVVTGIICGLIVGGLLYYGGSVAKLQIFLSVSTSILYLISAGLFSRGIWFFQNYQYNQKTGGDASENGSGPGTYNVKQSVWHVNCCNPEIDNGWDIFNSLLGWQNSATYGSVISYNVYWGFLILILQIMQYEERNDHLPFCKLKSSQLKPKYWLGLRWNKIFRKKQDKSSSSPSVDSSSSVENLVIREQSSSNKKPSFN